MKRFSATTVIFGILMLIALFHTSRSYAIDKVNDTYIIQHAEDLDAFCAFVNSGDSAINGIVVNDIFYHEHTMGVGDFYQKKPFCGVLDGAGHTITINYKVLGGEIALVKYLAHGGVVKNLHVNGNINSCGSSFAALVGHMKEGTISNCLATVDIVSDVDRKAVAGGLVGSTWGNCLIQNCIYQGSISVPNGSFVAGLVGEVMAPGTILENCISVCQLNLVESDTTSNAIINCENPGWATMHNVYYCGTKGWPANGCIEITSEEVGNQTMYYDLFNAQFRILENTAKEKTILIENKEKEIKQLWWACCLTLLLLITLTIIFIVYFASNRNKKQEYQILYESLKLEQSMLKNQGQETNEERENNLNENVDGGLRHMFKRLNILMEERELYIDPNLSEKQLAREMCTNTKRLSKCINDVTGKNFASWLAQFRVEHAISLMKETGNAKDYDGILRQSGFASRSTFFRQFRDVTGDSPIQYMKTQLNSTQQSTTNEPNSVAGFN